MRISWITASLATAAAAFSPTCAPLRHQQQPRPALRLRVPAAPRAQQGPLEEGFKELMPGPSEEDGNVDPELVARMDEEVFQLTGVGLDDLLNPSKVVNYER